MKWSFGFLLMLSIACFGCKGLAPTTLDTSSASATGSPVVAPNANVLSEPNSVQDLVQAVATSKPPADKTPADSPEDLGDIENAVIPLTTVCSKPVAPPATPVETDTFVHIQFPVSPETNNGLDPLAGYVWVEHAVDSLSDLDSGATPRSGPEIAVGDVTGDGKPEILFALEGGERIDQEGIFWRHPVTLAWNGTSFDEIDATWTGIPQPAPNLWKPFSRQGLPFSVAVADVDRDGINEVIVGTNQYRNPLEYGGIFIFEWDGAGFETEYADYCIGPVTRLDVLGNGDSVALSAWGKPSSANAQFDGVCPDVWRDLGAPRATLFLLTSKGPDEYCTRAVVSGQGELSSFSVNPQDPLATHFVWFGAPPTTGFWQDWKAATSYDLNGEIVDKIVSPQTEYLGTYSGAADLDGDGVDEIVTLAGKNSALGDEYVWQIFHLSGSRYRMVFQSGGSQRGASFFAAGDIDNNGEEDIIDRTGRVFSWNDSSLCYQGNVIEAAGLELGFGFESIAVGDVYGDGQNRLVVTGRPVEERNGNICKDCLPPAAYVIKVELPDSDGVCLEE